MQRGIDLGPLTFTLAMSLVFLAVTLPLTADEPGFKPTSLRIEPLTLKTGKGSALPNLTRSADGSVLITRVEPIPAGKGVRLRLSTLSEEGWSEPVTAAQGTGWFVNWADFPSAAVLADGTIAVHWLGRISDETYAYGVNVSISRDQGKSWSEPIIPHRDSSPTEHGFLALRSLGDRFYLAWLDGRAMVGGSGKPMTLRSTTISADGTRGIDRLLDDRVCDCCPLDAVVQGEQITLVYRDRDHLDVRDISWMTLTDDDITDTGLVHEDGWVQEGCPVNGPSIAISGEDRAVAWFTGVDRVLDKPSPEGAVLVKSLSNSDDNSIPVRIDDGRPIGRVDLTGLEDGTFLVCWLERKGEGAEVRVRRWGQVAAAAGEDSIRPRIWSSHLVGKTSPGRRSGYPRIISSGSGAAVVAWTETGVDGGTAVRTVRLPAAEKKNPSSE